MDAAFSVTLHQPNGEKAPSTARQALKKHRTTMERKRNAEATSPFTNYCILQRNMANTIHNWLTVSRAQTTQMIYVEQGCMRSVRLACLQKGSHEVTKQSLVQLVVIPANFDNPQQRGIDHKNWQLLIYSWLNTEDTRRMIQHLQDKQCTGIISYFRVRKDGCEKIV